MGIDHGATLVYGYEIEQFKTYDDIPKKLTDKTRGDYPEGREVLEKLVQEYDKLGYSHDASRRMIVGVELADIHRTGVEEIKEEKLDILNKDLKSFEEGIKNIAWVKNEKPKILLHSTMMG